MKKKLILIILLSIFSCKNHNTPVPENENFTIGIITDCQYCDCDVKWNRYYKKSTQRLKEAVNELNKHDLTYTIHLGDFIDKDFNSFDSITPIWNQLKSKSYHVLGNHDFEVTDSLKHLVPAKMGLKNRYYSFNTHNWKFIILDGNDLSLYGSLDSLKINEANTMFSQKQKDSVPYAQIYNGGLSKKQMTWIKQELDLGKKSNLNIGFFNHFPANPIDHHNFWNTKEFLELIKEYSNVKLFMNGHNHDGAYIKKDGVHYITFKGMVDTENESSFARVTFTKDSILIKGYGREENRRLNINSFSRVKIYN